VAEVYLGSGSRSRSAEAAWSVDRAIMSCRARHRERVGEEVETNDVVGVDVAFPIIAKERHVILLRSIPPMTSAVGGSIIIMYISTPPST